MADFTFTESAKALNLVNDALTEIKQSVVTAAQLDASAANQTDAEERASATFIDNIKTVLTEWNFNSITKQTGASLTRDSSRTTGFWYVYDLPSDFLRLNEILIANTRYNPKNIPHEIEDDKLLMNVINPVIRYNYFPAISGYDDTAAVTAAWDGFIEKWNPWLRQSVVMFLQHKWSGSIKRDSNMALEKFQLYEEYLTKAKLVDGTGKSVQTQDSGPLVYARMGYMPGGY